MWAAKKTLGRYLRTQFLNQREHLKHIFCLKNEPCNPADLISRSMKCSVLTSRVHCFPKTEASK